MAALSIIIPIAQEEAYLPPFVDSIFSRGVEDLEIIVITAGINAPRPLREDTRIKLLHVETPCIYAAYNRGIIEAEGQYVLFWNKHSTGDILSLVEKNAAADYECDIAFMHAKVSLEGQTPRRVLRGLGMALLADPFLETKFIRRDLLVGQNIQFIENNENTLYVNLDFLARLYVQAKTFKNVDFPYYHSDTVSISGEQHFDNIRMVLSNWTELAEAHPFIMRHWMAKMYIWKLLPLYGQLPAQAKQDGIGSLRDFAWLLEEEKPVKLLHRVLGLRGTAYIMAFCARMRHKNIYEKSEKGKRKKEDTHEH